MGGHRLARVTDRATRWIEHAAFLDPMAEAVGGWVGRITPAGWLRDLASGTPTGHPVHPPLTAVSVGSFTLGTLLQVSGADRRGARHAVGLGLIAALPTALAGAADWSYTAGAERRVGLVHAVVNDLAVSCYLACWIRQRSGRRGRGSVLALSGWAVLAVGGALGGHLGYGMGVGVDTTSFQPLDIDWTDAAAEQDIPQSGALGVHVAGVPILLVRHRGSVAALADRCTHRGGPLHEGTVADGCVECPWHGSRFSLDDGGVVTGPAVRPQPTLRVRVVGGRVQVCRREQRALRMRPVR